MCDFQVAGPGKAVISRWQDVTDQVQAVQSELEAISRLRDEFLRAHSNSLLMLSGISAQLTQLELSGDASVTRVDALRRALDADSTLLSTADRTGLELMQTCRHSTDVQATQDMVDEYQALYKDLLVRFTSLR